MSYILAIESSCDETSASVIYNGKVLNNVIATQSVHEIYGGVVPELASRAHMKKILPVVKHALETANIGPNELSAVAFTKGPGLLGSLLVGASFAKGMAISLGIPLIGIDHMKAHILAHFIEDPKPEFPFLCLTVSGGHTQLVMVHSPLKMNVIGETKDDAIGEAFDKCAKIMGLPYPGGPLIDKYAQEGNETRFVFPKTEMPDFDYSFSGIKTSFLYFLQNGLKEDPHFINNNLQDICASLQKSLIDMLFEKLWKAVEHFKVKQVAIAGGVSANSALRNRIVEWADKTKVDVFVPDFQYCTDNAAMIAMAAHFHFEERLFEPLDTVPSARLEF